VKPPVPGVTAVVPPSGAPIRIGLAILQSGPGAPQGKEILLAMKIWQEDTNVRGGLLGRPVEIVAHDDEGRPSNVASLYARLLDIDRADLVVSGWPTILIASAMPVVMQRNKLFLGLLGQDVNSGLGYPRYFSMSPGGPGLRGALTRGLFSVAMTQNPKPRTVAISAVDEPSCKDVTDGARDQAKAAGLPVVYDDSYADSTTDFAPIVRALAEKNPELVVVCSLSGDAVAFVRAVNDAGFKPKMIGGAMPALLNASIKAELGPTLNGWISFEHWLPVPAMQFDGASAVLSRYHSRARDEGANLVGHQLALWSYARLQILQQAVEATKSLDDTRLADYIRGATFKTVVGEVRFGDRGEWAEPRIVQVQFQNIRDNDIEQFRDARTQVVVDPPGYKSGNLIYPFADARK
jgi:branched-chain amino acid transport system substrate-binding protein